MSINRDEVKRCNRKASHMSTAWGFRACSKHAVGGMMAYNRELEPSLKYKKDYQRCDQLLYAHDCEDYVEHGLYARPNGSTNDYYYCGKCNALLQTG